MSVTIPLFHPRNATLNRYADRTLPPRAMRSVGAHMIGCLRCRQTVDEIIALRTRVRDTSAPTASTEMFERILARRQAGERVILPTPDLSRERSAPWGRIAIAAGLFVIATASAVLLSRSATAATDDGDLSFLPTHPRAGDAIDATYSPSERFVADTLLMLRVRSVTPPQEVPPGFEEVLPTVSRLPMRRGQDGAFHLRFTFPGKAVYSAFGVEDISATRLDAHRGKRWELLAYDANGHPRYDALLSATRERAGWDARHEAAQMFVAEYPDSIGAWRTLASTENVAHAASDSTAIAAARAALARFDELERSTGHSTPVTMSELYALASTLHDTTRLAYWREHILREAPRSRTAATLRGVHAIERLLPDPHALPDALPELDRIWNDVGAVDPSFTTFGLQSAIAAEDPVAISRWGTRYRAMTRDVASSREWVGSELVKYSQSRAEGLALLRTILAPLDVVNDPRRGLRQTAISRQREIDELRAATLQHIGEALLADHQTRAALDSLRLAADVSWNPDRFRMLASAALTIGDTAEATSVLALVAADPTTSATFTDSARVLLGRTVSDSAWSRHVAEATQTMQARVLALSTHRPMRGDRIRLLTSTGERRTFAQLADGHVTVVAFGADLQQAGSPVDLHEMQRLSATLAKDNARLVVIALHPRTAGMPEAIRQRHLSIDVYFDEYHEANRAFDAYGFPIYCVVDARGTIRFTYSEVSQLLAQVRALEQEQQLAQVRR
ncbi:MAG: hypothetical protein M3Z05_03105 [Gemmatimonadota bacterium]|nr:hypothetical protein [Gemmatimonadota bacterium]